ncbi:MAG: hypothetical protein GY811_22000 [Myxococcales bacterium]|jgi:hypothetical protein|nr:hypothetical protein [Myxococcales bacterium]
MGKRALQVDKQVEQRARLQQCLALRGVSAALLERIVTALGHGDDAGDAIDVSARAMQRSQTASVADLISAVRLQPKIGTPFRWSVALPHRLMPRLLSDCPLWSSMFWEAMRRFPVSRDRPWRLLLYYDDIGVGNALKIDNRRNQLAVYASFLEFGSFLQKEVAWLPIGTLRVVVKKSIGGSAVARALLRALFLGPESLSEHGAPIGGVHFFAKFHRLIADEAAGKETFCTKGAAGLRPCLQCKNVVLDQAECLADYDDDDYLVPLWCADSSRFDPLSSDEFLQQYDDLASLRDTTTRANIERLEPGRKTFPSIPF